MSSVLLITAEPARICSFVAQRKHHSKKSLFLSVCKCCQVLLLSPDFPCLSWCPFSWEHSVLGGWSWSTQQLLALSQAQKLGQAQRDQQVSFPSDGCAQEYVGEESKSLLLLLQEQGRCSLAGKIQLENN